MASSVLTYTIGDYRRIDSEPTDQYAALSVQDVKQWALNHNSLLARRCRQVLVTQAFDRDGTSPTEPLRTICSGTSSTNLGLPIYRVTIAPTQWFSGELKCAIHAEVGAAGPQLIPRVVMGFMGQELPVVSGYYFAPTSATRTFVECSVARQGLGVGEWFELYSVSPMTGADLKGVNANVTDAGDDWVDVDATTGATAGTTMFYCPSDAEIQPRLIIGIEGLRLYMDRPWNKRPDANTPDTANWRSVDSVGLYSLCLYQERAASFSFGLGMIP